MTKEGFFWGVMSVTFLGPGICLPKMRGVSQKGGGILNSAKKVHECSEESLFQQSKERLEEVMHWGTGAIEIKSGYGLTPEAELKMLRVIRRLGDSYPLAVKATFLAAHALPDSFKGNTTHRNVIFLTQRSGDTVCRSWETQGLVFCNQGCSCILWNHKVGEYMSRSLEFMFNFLKSHYSPMFSNGLTDIYISNKLDNRQKNYYHIHISSSVITLHQHTANNISKINCDLDNFEIIKNDLKEGEPFLEQFMTTLENVGNDIQSKKAICFKGGQ